HSPLYPTLSLHDALPIFASVLTMSGSETGITCSEPTCHSPMGMYWTSSAATALSEVPAGRVLPSCPPLVTIWEDGVRGRQQGGGDRKSTRLNSSHQIISY